MTTDYLPAQNAIDIFAGEQHAMVAACFKQAAQQLAKQRQLPDKHERMAQ